MDVDEDLLTREMLSMAKNPTEHISFEAHDILVMAQPFREWDSIHDFLKLDEQTGIYKTQEGFFEGKSDVQRRRPDHLQEGWKIIIIV